jgi:Tat protein translocase TatB subunit
MFGLGLTELVVILVVALLFLGPEKLPEVARTLGRGLRELRRASDDIRDTVSGTVNDAVRELRVPPARPAPPAPREDGAASVERTLAQAAQALGDPAPVTPPVPGGEPDPYAPRPDTPGSADPKTPAG